MGLRLLHVRTCTCIRTLLKLCIQVDKDPASTQLVSKTLASGYVTSC